MKIKENALSVTEAFKRVLDRDLGTNIELRVLNDLNAEKLRSTVGILPDQEVPLLIEISDGTDKRLLDALVELIGCDSYNKSQMQFLNRLCSSAFSTIRIKGFQRKFMFYTYAVFYLKGNPIFYVTNIGGYKMWQFLTTNVVKHEEMCWGFDKVRMKKFKLTE
jgi:hypothetical protein